MDHLAPFQFCHCFLELLVLSILVHHGKDIIKGTDWSLMFVLELLLKLTQFLVQGALLAFQLYRVLCHDENLCFELLVVLVQMPNRFLVRVHWQVPVLDRKALIILLEHDLAAALTSPQCR